MVDNICAICHRKGKGLVNYCKGDHCFHPSCIHKWRKYTNQDLYHFQISEKGAITHTQVVDCPYCKIPIKLGMCTRSKDQCTVVHNTLSWYIQKLSRSQCAGRLIECKYCNHLDYSTGHLSNTVGICDICNEKDHIINMKNQDSDGNVKWLCTMCRTRLYIFDENFIECSCSTDLNERASVFIMLFNEILK